MGTAQRGPDGDEKDDAGAAAAGGDVLIVGIGASAGGVEALQRFFKSLPEDVGGLAFVVILHLAPDRESNLAGVLQLHTPLAVRQVTERVSIEAGYVYVIPPGKSLLVSDHHLAPSEFEKPRGQRAPIDLFFRSLSEVHGEGVGILLSGGGTDGTIGLKAIKEQGGVVMVQAPDDAAHDSMPRSAIAAGLADVVLPAEGLAKKLIEYRQDRRRINVPNDAGTLAQDDARALFRILEQLRSRTGHDFSSYKHSTILRRIGRRMQMNQVESLSEYLEFLRHHSGESQALLKNLLISVTHFFRDPEVWDAFALQVVPKMLASVEAEDQVRVWVPGCATGEEAYGITMLLLEEAGRLGIAPEIQVFASDLDGDALGYGRQGRYPEAIAADVPEERLRRFFTKEAGHYVVRKEVRERILFAAHSVLKDPPFSKLNLISCRNLLIYLNRDLQDEVFRLFHYALRPGGYLLLGSAESIDADAGLFQPIDKRHRIFRRQETDKAPRLPSLQLAGRAAGRTEWTAAPVHDRSAPSQFERHRLMLEEHAPPSMMVSRDYELLHLSETAGRYLRRPGGLAVNDALREVRSELRIDLQAALYEAFERGRRTSTQPVEVRLNGDVVWVHLIVQPTSDEHGRTEAALVLFIEVETVGLHGDGPAAGRNARHEEVRVQQMEDEAQRLRDRLQATVEEYESSREEMKASNEELQSINEEYKSTAEELETSKEELQSVNEELETVNQELKAKVEELSESNSDLQNLMAATEIGTLFLDRSLRIKRYTPRVTELFNIMPGDVGRPIGHLTHKVDDDALVADADRVLRDLAVVEREVRGREGSWFLMRLRPYRTLDDHIDGVVITFIDITRRREEEEERRRAEERYRLLVESVAEYAIIMLDEEGRITTWNVGAQRQFGYTEAEATGRSGGELFTEEDQATGVPEKEMTTAAETGQAHSDRWHARKDGSHFWSTGVMTALHASGGELRGFAKVMRDNTERKQAEELLEQRVEERTEQVRSLMRALTMAEQGERHRIARILHDDLQQQLFGLGTTLGLLRDPRSDEEAHALLEQAGVILDECMRLTRNLSIELSPPVLKRGDLEETLQWLALRKKEEYGLDVEVEVRGEVLVPERNLRVLLYQALRELLFNVVKHAGVDHARVSAWEEEGEVIVRVQDGGRGFDLSGWNGDGPRGSGFGLPSVQERLSMVGGRFEVASSPDGGTCITIAIPSFEAEDGT